MPSKDIPGNVKHIRFSKLSAEIYEALVGIPGVKAVVLHKIGKQGEHPHWHIWWEGEKPITNVTWQNHAKKLPALKDFFGNKDWGFRNHNSWEAWATYVCANLSHEVLLGYKDLATYSEKGRIVPVSIATPITPDIPAPAKVVKSLSRLRWDEKICLDAETRLGWKRNCEFSLASYEDHAVGVSRQIERQVSSFMKMRLNNNEAVKYCRNLLYEFSDDDLRDYLERKVFEKISWI